MWIAIRSLVVLLLVSSCALAADAEWGHLTGRFIYDGPAPEPKFISTKGKDGQLCGEQVPMSLLIDKKTGGVANIVVYLRTKDVKVHPEYEATAKAEVPVIIENCRYEPHVVLLRVSQTMVWINKDNAGFGPTFQPLGEAGVSKLLNPRDEPFPYRYQRSRAMLDPMGRVIHSWMKAYVLCRDNPYTAATKENGSFEIKLIPAGEHEFQFLHEKTQWLVAKPEWIKGRARFTIKAGETMDLGDIKLDPKLFSDRKG